MRRRTVVVLLGSAGLAAAVVAGAAIAAAGKKAHTSGAGTTSSEHAPGKFQVNAKAEEEGVLGGARGHVRFSGHIDDPTTLIRVPADLELDVVCMTNTTHQFEGQVVGRASTIGAQDPATGLYYHVVAADDVLEGRPLASAPDQFHISGPYDWVFCGPGGPSASGHFDVTKGNVVVKDAAA